MKVLNIYSCFTPALPLLLSVSIIPHLNQSSIMLFLWTKGSEVKSHKFEKKESNEHKHHFSITLLASKSTGAFILTAFLKTLSLNCSQEIAEERSQGRRERGKKRERNKRPRSRAGVLSRHWVWVSTLCPFRKASSPHKFPYPTSFLRLKMPSLDLDKFELKC